MNKLLLPLLCLPLLGACAFGYQARGTLDGVAGELRGKGFPGNAHGGGRFILADREGRLTCDGTAFPPSASSTPGSCAGETGDGVVRCSDGREITIRWQALSCRAFSGSGEDRQGNKLNFRVDRNR